MSALNDQHIKTLNTLIATTVDSAYGYMAAAQDTTNPHLKTLFQARGMERRQLTAELEAEVRSLGGTPEAEGTWLAATDRMFVNLKNILMHGDKTIISEVEAGEDHIKAKFEHALKNDNLPAPVQESVVRVYGVIKAGHDQMKDLKRQLELAPANI